VSDELPAAARAAFHRRFVFGLAVGVSILFFFTVRRFLMPLVLAAVLAGLAFPLHRWIAGKLRGRRNLSALSTLAVLAVLVLLPSLALLGAVAGQALKIGQAAVPWVRVQLAEPTAVEQRVLDRFPQLERLTPYREQMLKSAGTALERTGSFLVGSLSALTRGTALFLLNLFLFLYALFFFLRDGRAMIDGLFELTPLSALEKERLLERLRRVSRALLRGTFVIGVLQGGLAAGALALAGIPDALFWFFVMAVLSILPGIGAFLVWGPAAIYLFVQGETMTAILLTAWCAAVVGSIDNFLRPRLVGSEAQLSDLMVLVATLGGLAFFGAAGFIVGPILAGLFITVWDFYRETYRAELGPPAIAESPTAG
jgi:predicted PurR-regulated permease PerM